MLKQDDVQVEVSDDEIYQAAMEEWLNVLARLWVAFDKPLDPVRLALYQGMLNKLPLGLLELAVERVVREHKYNSVPTVAQVWEAVRKELRNPFDLDQAIDTWCELKFQSCFYRFDGVSAETEG